jgi:hypothetical protein
MAECKTNNKNYNHWKTTKKTKAGYKTLTLWKYLTRTGIGTSGFDKNIVLVCP